MRIIVGLVVALALAVAGYSWVVLHWSYSTGERAGWLQKMSHKGWICKTWEGELAMVSMPGAIPEKFYFTVRDDAVAEQDQRGDGQAGDAALRGEGRAADLLLRRDPALRHPRDRGLRYPARARPQHPGTRSGAIAEPGSAEGMRASGHERVPVSKVFNTTSWRTIHLTRERDGERDDHGRHADRLRRTYPRAARSVGEVPRAALPRPRDSHPRGRRRLRVSRDRRQARRPPAAGAARQPGRDGKACRRGQAPARARHARRDPSRGDAGDPPGPGAHISEGGRVRHHGHEGAGRSSSIARAWPRRFSTRRSGSCGRPN